MTNGWISLTATFSKPINAIFCIFCQMSRDKISSFRPEFIAKNYPPIHSPPNPTPKCAIQTNRKVLFFFTKFVGKLSVVQRNIHKIKSQNQQIIYINHDFFFTVYNIGGRKIYWWMMVKSNIQCSKKETYRPEMGPELFPLDRETKLFLPVYAKLWP